MIILRMILSFDIGIRNLAYAYIDINSVKDFKILDVNYEAWENNKNDTFKKITTMCIDMRLCEMF